jgi:hypothetical protein
MLSHRLMITSCTHICFKDFKLWLCIQELIKESAFLKWPVDQVSTLFILPKVCFKGEQLLSAQTYPTK